VDLPYPLVCLVLAEEVGQYPADLKVQVQMFVKVRGLVFVLQCDVWMFHDPQC